jgi:hypothetical protein
MLSEGRSNQTHLKRGAEDIIQHQFTVKLFKHLIFMNKTSVHNGKGKGGSTENLADNFHRKMSF